MENISNLIVTAVAIIGAITAALIGGLTEWTFRDIRSRSRDFLVQVLASVMVGVVPIAGILVYFMLRPRETLAEAYVRALEEESLLASIEHFGFENRSVSPPRVGRESAYRSFSRRSHARVSQLSEARPGLAYRNLLPGSQLKR